jgi:hypothetical protein
MKYPWKPLTLEDLTIFTMASMRKFYGMQNWGVPVTYLQQEEIGNVEVRDEVQLSVQLRFPHRGSVFEVYGLAFVRALVKTKVVPSDVYYHIRTKARATQILTETLPLLRTGGPDTTIFTGHQWGILRRVPSSTITVTASSIDVPNSSVVDAVYEIQEIPTTPEVPQRSP